MYASVPAPLRDAGGIDDDDSVIRWSIGFEAPASGSPISIMRWRSW
jgi:hypothetical protein